MYFSNLLTTLDSISFLIKITQKVTKPLSYTTFEYEGCSANFYCQNKKKYSKGLMIIFIGVNQQGNTDPRYINLINGLMSIGYNCLILQLQPFVNIIAPVQKDFDLVTAFLNYVLNNKVDAVKTISFIGPSTSCLYMIKVGTSELLKNKVRSMCFISPFFDPLTNFREILENPRSFYAQLVLLKLILHSQHEQDPQSVSTQELLIINKCISICFEKGDEHSLASVLHYINSESRYNKKLIPLIKKLGKSEFISNELYPHFMDVVRKITYTDCLPQVQSKITLIHAYTDTVFSPMCSTQLANMLTQYNINNHVAITKIFDHADLIPKNLPKEFFILLKALNHFFL